MKTKEQIAKYNKEYFSRPEVIARAKERNAQENIKLRRKLYKKTEKGREAENRYRRNAYMKNKDKRNSARYGITIEELISIRNSQNNCCAICFVSDNESKLHIDHDHNTKKVRGLLCGSCNRGIGMFKESLDSMNNAINYLKNGRK